MGDLIGPAIGQIEQGVGIGASAVGSNIQANALGNAAQAQLSAQSALQAQAQGLTAPSAAELLNQNQQLQAQQQNLQRQQQLLAAVDPAFMEAGKQALAILQGKSAPTLGPLQEEQTRQRNNLIQQLIAQMGPGALGTSAGQAALRQFDQQAQLTTSQQQQSYLGTLLGASSNAEQFGNPLETIQSMQGTQSQMQNQQALQANALIGTSVTPYSGAPYAASYFKGKGLTNLGNTLSQQGASMMSSGKGGGATATSNQSELGSIQSADSFQAPQFGSALGAGAVPIP